MRLLRLSDHGELSLTTHDADKLPPYAILSHTWGTDDDEVKFADIVHGVGKDKAGYAKLMFCGEQALEDDLKDFWVDACCINKDSDSELSEAIISMFRWYQKAAKCYVYLDDVTVLKHDRDGSPCGWEDAFRKSRWFTRGWTLQEMLAPKEVEFYSRNRQLLGTKETLKDLIHYMTDIPTQALLGTPLSGFSTFERRRWAVRRDTKKKEDKAYCLMGIFDVSIPILYGEGEDKAQERLSAEVSRSQNPTGEAAASTRNRESPETTRQTRRETLLASLAFEQIDSRHSTIKYAQRTTCEWLLQHPHYVAWNNEDRQSSHYGILWVAGKPGAGKSTLMKFALGRARKPGTTDEILLHFFFNARGDSLEKTTLGMYRALLFQLLTEAPDLKGVLDYANAKDSSLHGSQAPTWTLRTLQTLLRDAVCQLGSRKLIIFIDALDECNEEQVREMVDFFEDIGQFELAEESRLSICFASRHYPSIEIGHGWRLILEDEAGHAEDLRKYIHRRLKAGKGKTLDEVRAKVQEKANGVFMWAVLVVDVLNKEFERGRIFAVKQRLREIPTELSELFKDLLRRDRVNMDDLLLCLQWVLFAKRPLSREEFYYAMEAGLHSLPEDGSQWRPNPWDPEEVTAHAMDKFVLNSSKGLAELTRSKKAPTVQFIHESVRDFLLKDGGLQELWPQLAGDLAALSHNKLQKCCSDYLCADLSSCADLPEALPKASSKEAKTLRQQVTCQFPLLEYASQGVLHHANESSRVDTYGAVLQHFALDKWVYINNLLEPHDNRRYSDGVNLLYVLADHSLPQLIGSIAFQDRDVWLRLPQERYQFPVLAAFAHGNRDGLRALLGESSEPFLDRLMKDPGFNKASECRPSQDPLLWAAQNSNWAFAEFLLNTYAEGDIFSISKTSQHRSVFWYAAKDGSATVVQMLLNKDVDVNAQGVRFGAALQVASEHGHEKMSQILIEAGADVNGQGGLYGNALEAASYGGHEKGVQMLLEAGADVNVQGGFYGNALQAAVWRGHEKVVQMLIDAGAGVDGEGGSHGSAIHAASCSGHEKVVQILIDAGAEINAEGEYYGNALKAASSRGHEKVVRMLIDAGADVNAQGGAYGTALQAASSKGKEKVVRILIDAGADVNAQGGGRYRNALRAAENFPSNEKVVQILRSNGAIAQS